MVEDTCSTTILCVGENISITENKNWRTVHETNPKKAIQIIENESPAVIVCEQNPPVLDGFHFLQSTRSIYPDATRILLIDSNDPHCLASVTISEDAHFFVPKPLNSKTLIHAIERGIERHKEISHQRVVETLVAKQHEQLAKAHEMLRHELHVGSKIYDTFLSGRKLENIPGFDVAAITLPSQELDGDFYAFYQPAQNTVDLAFGDVMGKGLPAALIGTAVQSELAHSAVPLDSTLSCDSKGIWHPDLLSTEAILQNTHQEVIDKLLELQFFVSLFYARFDVAEKRLSYVDCGSTKPLHFKNKDHTFQFIEGENFPLGMVEETTYSSKEISYDEEDVFVFYSDGITESKDSQGNLFGLERLKTTLLENIEKEPQDMLEAVQASTQGFVIHDDWSLIIIKVKQPPGDLQPETKAVFTNDLSQLPAVREFIDRSCQIDPQVSNSLQLAINEIFCNIVKHGYGDGAKGNVTITTKRLKQGIVIDVADDGLPFDPRLVEEPNLAGEKEDGFGMFIVKNIADTVSYSPGKLGKRNHLQIYKQFRRREEEMILNHNTHGNVLVVSIDRDELDAKDAPLFKKKVIDLIGTNLCSNVVLDLTKLQFIDSSGLGSLLSILRHLNQNQGNLKIANVSPPVRATFEIVRMHKLFEIFNSTDEALRSFEG